MLNLSLDPEPVILSLTTEIYNYKCLVVLLQIENDELRTRVAALERFRLAAEALNLGLGLKAVAVSA